MDIIKYGVALSKAGRDKGRFFAVIEVNGEYAVIADGDLRKLENPKKKNLRHLSATKTVLDEEALRSNKQLRTALSELFPGNVRPQP